MEYTDELGQLIRDDTPLDRLPIHRYRVRAARSASELERAFSLLHEAYVGAGLQDPRGKALRITAQHVLSESVVFVGWEDDEAVGTITVTMDSPAGLPLDKDYARELGALRQRGARLAEVGSLAVRAPWRASGLHLLLGLVSIWALRRIFGASHWVIGVNPSHASLYRAVFGFKPLGSPRAHGELKAPVVCLVCDGAEQSAFYRRHYQRPLSNGHLVSEEFCGPLPPGCVEVPGALLRRDLTQWRISRSAFRRIFIHRSGHLYSLDPKTRGYLETQRTLQTLAHCALDEHDALPQQRPRSARSEAGR